MHYLVPPGLYAVGEPTAGSPVVVTGNYKMTYDAVRRTLAGRDNWVLVLETYGINVWCAAGKGTFGTEEIVRRVAASGLADMQPWSKVRVGGVVEGYRERIFKGGGGKVAFFILEDTGGRVEVKVRQNQIETYAAVLTSGEPVLVSGKVSFPQVEEGSEEPDGPKEPTLLLDEAVPLADAIRAATKSIALRLHARRAKREQIGRLGEILRQSPGPCPVSLTITLEDGAEAILALGKDLRIEPSDGMLARLEKLFGEKVAELR